MRIPYIVITIGLVLITGWLVSRKRELKASTHQRYRRIVDNLLIPKFGKTMLASWKRKDVKEWLAGFNCTNKRLTNVQNVIRKALADAVDSELIDDNFIVGWSYKIKEAPRLENDIDPFSREEQIAILAKCSPSMANQVQFSFWTGLRTSELVALDWADIDFVRSKIMVRKAMTSAAKGKIEDTKTASGKREVKILAPAMRALKAQKPHTFLAGDPVFRNPNTGERWTGDQQIREAWVRALKLAGVRYRYPYQTRHTYASMLLSAGEHPMWVAKQMGHADWTMISRIYGRWMPSADTDAGGKAEALFGVAEPAASKVS
ncbi:site-specific integrase [Candidimonas sp. SYP-B2681]|uniref:tyrosine-type recombinase/integrase n=1 Tax=Candidimonas sp. SYP-B2681 TaxID=2497686 RepID=UPI0018F30ACE|nr:site-specific integrase [Candidimonas sp. SYP-B2681]